MDVNLDEKKENGLYRYFKDHPLTAAQQRELAARTRALTKAERNICVKCLPSTLLEKELERRKEAVVKKLDRVTEILSDAWDNKDDLNAMEHALNELREELSC